MTSNHPRCLILLRVLVLLALAGCSALPFQLGSPPPSHTATPGQLPTPTVLSTAPGVKPLTPAPPEATAVATQRVDAGALRLWLPPEFAADASNPAGSLLKTQLEAFTAENPDITLDVRVKALDGNGGMLDSLLAASAAAPLALPDLVLLPRPLLESAVLKGLLYPYDGLTALMDDPGWFDYARQLASLKSNIYGIPFAGDALVLVYHPSLLTAPPADLEAALSSGQMMLIPAADPQASFTLSMYLAKGGSLLDDEGRPALDETLLLSILEFYQRASQSGMMVPGLADFSTDEQVWAAFVANQSPMAVVWASTYLKHRLDLPGDAQLTLLPAPDASPFTLATGWCWALAGQDPVRRAGSVRLVEYLAKNQFQANWTFQAGYLPPKNEALQNWQDATLRQALEQVSTSAWLSSPADLLSSLGPALRQAVMSVLTSQSDPQTAVKAILEQIEQP